jgi:hypothetical protein
LRSLVSGLSLLVTASLAVILYYYTLDTPTVAVAQSGPAARPATLKLDSGGNLPSSVAVEVKKVAPPGSTLYWTKRGDTVSSVARHFLVRSSYLTSAQLADALRQANSNLRTSSLQPGQALVVPGILDAPIVEKSVAVPRDFEVRAVYLTGLMAGCEHGLEVIRRWRKAGGNAVVFDIKDSDGSVNIPFEHALLGPHHTPIPDLPKLVRFLHDENLHAIARIAVFRDQRLVDSEPELAVKSRRTGQPWRENGKLVWTDPSQPKVQDYNLALARRAAESGVDEVQFDYIRFPAEGDQKDASFRFASEHPGWQRSDVIRDFLERAYAKLHPMGVLVSLDVFGVMAWRRPVDLSHTGQDIVKMAKHCDVLSPMIYPSHFFGMDGYAHPGDAPEHFIGESMKRFEQITQGSGVVIRPWLQAFRWRTKTYSPKYVETEVLAAKQEGGIGFLFWNAANDYSKPLAAMGEMGTVKGQYFRGDEVRELAPVAGFTTPSGSAPLPSQP